YGLYLVSRQLQHTGGVFSWPAIFNRTAMLFTLAVNTNIMIRSLALTFAFAFFTARSAAMGDDIVAANSILMHLFTITAFFLDGFAFSAEALAGQAVGARNRARFERAVRLSGMWGLAVAAFMSLAIFAGGGLFADLMTISGQIRLLARQYLFWAAISPLTGIACFIYDGVFTGATRTADMRNMMLASLAVFLAAWWAFAPLWGNDGLWAALNLFLIVRGIALWARMPALRRALF
ncbi:MAG TPA: MATE family efflux transporter, partial [Rhizobiales bacterium]|nr:MATE family efflux transporter [Hyphomicrobiales bacterium]